MSKDSKTDWYWPLGGIHYSHEIRDWYPEEAEMLGILTILWNRQENTLRNIFIRILQAKKVEYAEAIWDRQPTHQAKRDLLALALQTARLSKRQAGILRYVIDKTKLMADRRNELLHAEYVVHGRTDRLHARVKAPRSAKPPIHHPAGKSDLAVVITDLEYLLQATEAASLELLPRGMRTRLNKLFANHTKSETPTPENQ
jgi:hypothetical protein